jgi:hypothetical protein
MFGNGTWRQVVEGSNRWVAWHGHDASGTWSVVPGPAASASAVQADVSFRPYASSAVLLAEVQIAGPRAHERIEFTLGSLVANYTLLEPGSTRS